MMYRVAMNALIVMLSAFLLPACTDRNSNVQEISHFRTVELNSSVNRVGIASKVVSEVESAADKLFSMSNPMSRDVSIEAKAQSCASDDTAIITIYSTNGMAQNEIDVRLNGSPVGSLKTYFPDGEPGCKSPSAEGVITIMVPAGRNTIDADSGNISWPSHVFSVDKCECMVLPLS